MTTRFAKFLTKIEGRKTYPTDPTPDDYYPAEEYQREITRLNNLLAHYKDYAAILKPDGKGLIESGDLETGLERLVTEQMNAYQKEFDAELPENEWSRIDTFLLGAEIGKRYCQELLKKA